ncbi:MAG: sigma-70 family RNA polymerase sigma factor [Acidobacteriia bacterium]|nr:sigma-70 family RNA polymerase sigma factor [Terriglobia bacterium]
MASAAVTLGNTEWASGPTAAHGAAGIRLLDSEYSLVSRCLSGDETAWEQFVREHTRHVYAICYRFTGSSAQAQDLTQEVFLRVFRTLKSFRSAEGSLGTWLTRVTRNLLIDHYRRSRQERVTDPIEERLPVIEEAGNVPRPDQALAGREASEILQQALEKLSPDLREAVILRDLQEMEYREIAQALAIPEGTVKSRINRGRAELGRLLRQRRAGL